MSMDSWSLTVQPLILCDLNSCARKACADCTMEYSQRERRLESVLAYQLKAHGCIMLCCSTKRLRCRCSVLSLAREKLDPLDKTYMMDIFTQLYSIHALSLKSGHPTSLTQHG